MADTNEKERKCIRFLAGEMSLEDRMMFQIELELDKEMKNLYQELKDHGTFIQLILQLLRKQEARVTNKGKREEKINCFCCSSCDLDGRRVLFPSTRSS